MATIAEKIESNAQARLGPAAERTPAEQLARYKSFLKVENHRLRLLHHAGAPGREVCQARAALLDVLVRRILEDLGARAAAGGRKQPKFALAALGGYGRAELNPFSDVDVMLLHEMGMAAAGRARPELDELAGALIRTLWDAGFKVGSSVRSIADCVQVANTDMKSKTSFIEARLVAGDAGMFERMQAVVLAKCVRGHEQEYLHARIADQAARRGKHGNSPFMQEPNIKDGCGGLRDYQNLLWMTFFQYRTRSLAELEANGLLSGAERRQLEGAYDFLLRVRNELHYTAKRGEDVLRKAHQPAVAHALGYTERSPSERLERFMKEVYTRLRQIYIITRTIEERLALLPAGNGRRTLKQLFQAGKRRMTEQVVDGFVIVDGRISETTRSFKQQPRRLLRLFLYMQQRGLKLHPDVAQGIRNELDLVNRGFLEDEHNHQTFLEILGQRGNVAPVLRRMHEVGLLGKFVPEFGKLTCLVQHEFFHRYTTDEHTLVCLEKLDEVWESKNPELARYGQLLQQVERPHLLYLALLLHDAGKALRTGDHSDSGAKIALRAARRLGLDGAATHTLRLLVEQHLLMSQVSQRRDLEDHAVILAFAKQVQSREALMMLTLLTYADAKGTSEELWNSFKDSLLWTLFSRTMDFFAGTPELNQAEARQLELLKEQVAGALPPTFSREEIAAHFENLPARYFQIHSVREIAADISLAHRFMHLQMGTADVALEPVVRWHDEPDRGCTSVHVCTWDRAGLFAKIAGSLAAAGLNILSAQIFSRADGIILDTFFAHDAQGGAQASREEKEACEKILNQALSLEPPDLQAQIARRKRVNRIYQSVGGERIPTVIRLDNDISSAWTVLEISAEDRVGLLYAISRTLADLGLDISLAKIFTEKGGALDTFYVTTWDKKKIDDPDQQIFIEKRLRTAIEALG